MSLSKTIDYTEFFIRKSRNIKKKRVLQMHGVFAENAKKKKIAFKIHDVSKMTPF